MSYKLVFKKAAKEEWDKLEPSIKEQFKKKLKERLVYPAIEASRLSTLKDYYKIKLRSVGYRLVYQLREKELVVSVVAIGKRERNAAYMAAIKRL